MLAGDNQIREYSTDGIQPEKNTQLDARSIKIAVHSHAYNELHSWWIEQQVEFSVLPLDVRVTPQISPVSSNQVLSWG